MMILGQGAFIIIGAVVLTILLWVIPKVKARKKGEEEEFGIYKRALAIVLMVVAFAAVGAVMLTDFIGDSTSDVQEMSKEALDSR